MLAWPQDRPWRRQDLNQVSGEVGQHPSIIFILDFQRATSCTSLNIFFFKFWSGKPLWQDLIFLLILVVCGPQNENKLLKDHLSHDLPPLCVLKGSLKCSDGLFHLQGPRRFQKFQKQNVLSESGCFGLCLPSTGTVPLACQEWPSCDKNQARRRHFCFLYL